MSSFVQSTFLRRVLFLDAIASGATGLLMLGGAGFLTGLLRLPVPLLQRAGLLLVPYVAYPVVVALSGEVARAMGWPIIVGNALWVAASLLLLVGGWVAPTALGYAFVIAQAVVVGVFAELQYMALRKPIHAAA
jgi:hypothetical protein